MDLLAQLLASTSEVQSLVSLSRSNHMESASNRTQTRDNHDHLHSVPSSRSCLLPVVFVCFISEFIMQGVSQSNQHNS